MHFASPISLWLAILLAALAAAIAVWPYRRPVVPLSAPQRSVLIALRALALLALVVVLCRPVLLVPERQSDVVVPVLIDASRSMRIADADGRARIDQAIQTAQFLIPQIAARFSTDVFAVGEGVAPSSPDGVPSIRAEGRRSDLAAAADAVRERYRGRRIAGMVLISDGGDTGGVDADDRTLDAPVFAIGVGSASGVPDRELSALTAGEQALDQTSVDLRASVVSRGLGRAAFDVSVRANNVVLETRHVEPSADGSPVDVTFTVAPDTATPTVYTVEVSAADGETIPENNRRSILVNPAGRKRRVLFVAGAPGFDHSFLLRALGDDPGLEVDSVVRKGKNDDGRDTFVVQADASRAPKLAPGLPSKHEDLFAYDAIVLANYEGDGFTRAQLEAASQFVSERGGGLLMLGGRSFVQRGLAGTALESVLPVDLSDRRGQAGRSSYPMIRGAQLHAVSITPEGADHPVMRIGASREETEKRWAALPPLASNAPLGGPRPGASVLAVTTDQSGVYPLVAVQRFGRGRAMVFGGEASWRWQMLMPATDRSYERFWRQAVRWLAGPAPDPVSITVPDELEEGTAAVLHVDARDAAFVPAADAALDATLTGPDGASTTLALKHDPTGYSATTALGRAGLYRLHVDARQGTASLGSADRWFLAGSGEREFADPRLNEGVLRRLARTSGGRYVPIAEASRVAAWLSDAVPPADTAARRDIWNQPWVLGAIVSLLAAEWILRRRWGLH